MTEKKQTSRILVFGRITLGIFIAMSVVTMAREPAIVGPMLALVLVCAILFGLTFVTSVFGKETNNQ